MRVPRKAEKRVPQPNKLEQAAEGFCLGFSVGMVLPGPAFQLALARKIGDRRAARVAEMASPALALASLGSALTWGTLCGAARLIRGRGDA
jgi:hypothetical protein